MKKKKKKKEKEKKRKERKRAQRGRWRKIGGSRGRGMNKEDRPRGVTGWGKKSKSWAQSRLPAGRRRDGIDSR